MKKQFIILLMMHLMSMLYAQKFSSTLRYIPEGWNCELVAIPEQKVRGTIKNVEFENGFLSALTLRTISGQLVAFESKNILKVKIQGVTYEQHQLPSMGSKSMLLQLLNTDYEGDINVFLNPESDFYTENGAIKYYSYYYALHGSKEVSLVKKATFQKTAEELFGNCELICGSKALLQGEFIPFNFDEFASYLWHYNTYCN